MSFCRSVTSLDAILNPVLENMLFYNTHHWRVIDISRLEKLTTKKNGKKGVTIREYKCMSEDINSE